MGGSLEKPPGLCAHDSLGRGRSVSERRQVEDLVRRERVAPPLGIHVEKESESGRAHRDGEVHRSGVIRDGRDGPSHQCGEGVEVGGRGASGEGSLGEHFVGQAFFTRAPSDEGGESQGLSLEGGGGEEVGGDAARTEASSRVDDDVGSRRMMGRGANGTEGEPRCVDGSHEGAEEIEALEHLRTAVGAGRDRKVSQPARWEVGRAEDECSRGHQTSDDG